MTEPDKYRQAAAQALRKLTQHVEWKPGKDIQHLAKRKARHHLPAEATVADYNGIITEVLNVPSNLVYHYPVAGEDYYAVCGEVQSVPWLVLFGADGTMETAFPPNGLAGYLARHGFVLLGRVEGIGT